MTVIAIVEIVTVVFLAILFISQVSDRNSSKSSRMLNLCILLVLFTLIVDVMAYTFMDDSTPFAFRYLICLLAYLGEGICFLGFAFYSGAFFAKKKIDVDPRVFRILKILEIIWIAATTFEFVSGNMVIFENRVEVRDNGYPIYLAVYQILIMLFIPALAVYHRKKLGDEAVILLSFFNIAPIIGILTAIFAYYDYSYVLGAVALVCITEFPHRKRKQEQQAESVSHEVLKGNYERIFALEDNFESLYDVELESGNYDVFVGAISTVKTS